ncbi:hypothetical protein [Azospirillum argentinense]
MIAAATALAASEGRPHRVEYRGSRCTTAYPDGTTSVEHYLNIFERQAPDCANSRALQQSRTGGSKTHRGSSPMQITNNDTQNPDDTYHNMRGGDVTSPIASTVIQALGMTFAEAAERAKRLLTEQDAQYDAGGYLSSEGEDARDERRQITGALLEARPQTVDDALAVLDRLLCPTTGLGIPGELLKEHLTALQNLRCFLLSLKTDSKPLDDVIGDFGAEAVEVLALPVSLPEEVIDAAVQATGCTKDGVRAGFAAIVNTYQRMVA